MRTNSVWVSVRPVACIARIEIAFPTETAFIGEYHVCGKVWLQSQSLEESMGEMDTWLMVGCFQGVHTLRMIRSKAFGSQHSPNRHVAHNCGGGYSPRACLWLLLEFTQHMLFKFRCPRTPCTPCVVHPTDKRTGFLETPMQTFESFSIRQVSRRKKFSIQASRAFPSATLKIKWISAIS
ncbi:hypothetical protein TNCV_1014441 [Trichonephila clavipes]|uniref:Uncharacterized protein n=1 Tax=Trichonephila clavipes TaxID=2585209 RepID=A0A8X6VXW1_TRICX|nr:hypothetical protein TNCV_1014441 [Trichonephila clavipes]